jgi:ABC-2 type transport system ATP-binding protein
MSNVIEVDKLRKQYRRLRHPPTVAVAGLDLVVREGGVFGFLGPNGSGKTTTIRCLLGLVRPTSGDLRLLGQPVPAGLPTAIRRVGAVVETPALFPTMTARENLHLLARIDRIPLARADALLEELGLAERGDQTVKKYSLGMKQRLGLAAALLKEPELLILDEPANGLDPAGIRDVRQLLRRLGDEGRTVFLSSHLLAEVEHICDAVAILRHGACVATGSVHEVLSLAKPKAMIVSVPDVVEARSVLRRKGISSTVQGDRLRVPPPPGGGAAITAALASAGVWLSELRTEDVTLEDMFLELTGDPAIQPLEVVA